MDQISGFIEAIIYSQPENGFTVAKLQEPMGGGSTIIVGFFASVQPGETVVCKGNWRMHPSHGRQFEVKEFSIEIPSDVVGIQKYLESGLIKGIGPVFATRIVEKFGAETLTVIEQTPRRLLEVEGLGKKKLKQIVACWDAQRSIRDVMLFLRAHGVSPGYAQKIYKKYGEESVERVKENPYSLAKEVHGIGFKVADGIALQLGFPLHSSQRIGAGIEFVLWELSNEGHTCFPKEALLGAAAQTLEVDLPLVEQELQRLVDQESLIAKDGFVWLKMFYACEMGSAKDLLRLCKSHQKIRPIDAGKAADWVQEKLHIRFAVQQREAVIRALSDKVQIITGGPGTGKSTITKAILTVTEKLTDAILLAAPTGRAAKRLTQITGKKAFTIHSMLEMDFVSGGFKRNRENPLTCDLLIVDEASMIDTTLLFALLRAVPSGARVLLVGDVDQLPSVGPGMVLNDLIQSELIGVTRLTEIFRQARGSRIITNAHRINHGEFPALATPEESDFHFIEAETPEAIQQVILQLVAQEIPKRWGFDPLEDIQVLSPMKRGTIGSEVLNNVLQALLNPSHNPLFRAGHRFHIGDKVMQIKNDYDKEVFNGDIGKIAAIDAAGQVMSISFDGRWVDYDFSELNAITLAYATSVHKYQGSECPCIVVPIHTSHFKLLHRNLFYTAVTRGKKQVYLVGTKKAVAIAVNNNQEQKRYTGLMSALKETAATYRSTQDQQLELTL